MAGRFTPSINSWPGLLYNFAYAAFAWVYSYFLASPLKETAESVHFEKATATWSGVLILVALAVEGFAIVHKIRASTRPDGRSAAFFTIVFCAHHLLGYYIIHYAFISVGYVFNKAEPADLIFFVILPIVVKDMSLMMYFFMSKREAQSTPAWLDVAANLALIFCGLVFSTVLWDAQIKAFRDVALIPGIVPMLIACFCLFVPTRLGFLVSELGEEQRTAPLWLSIAFATVVGMWPILIGPLTPALSP